MCIHVGCDRSQRLQLLLCDLGLTSSFQAPQGVFHVEARGKGQYHDIPGRQGSEGEKELPHLRVGASPHLAPSCLPSVCVDWVHTTTI